MTTVTGDMYNLLFCAPCVRFAIWVLVHGDQVCKIELHILLSS